MVCLYTMVSSDKCRMERVCELIKHIIVCDMAMMTTMMFMKFSVLLSLVAKHTHNAVSQRVDKEVQPLHESIEPLV